MIKSKVLDKLRAGDYVLTAGVSRVTDPWLMEVLGRIGYDNIWFDLEHRSFPTDRVELLSFACRLAGIDLMVRIRKTGYQEPMQMLESGANGIMVPHCRSAEEARQWVDWMRFPPLGRRGFDGAGADCCFGLEPAVESIEFANRETFLVLQIEDREALDSIDDIAAVPGYDLLFIGPGDLSISLGVPMQTSSPLLNDAIDRVARACANHGKWWAIPTATPEIAQQMLDRGARMITGGGDHGMLVNGFQESFGRFSQVRVRE
jgi:4-hydroxy-2-oxoheptanedioate aldolase